MGADFHGRHLQPVIFMICASCYCLVNKLATMALADGVLPKGEVSFIIYDLNDSLRCAASFLPLKHNSFFDPRKRIAVTQSDVIILNAFCYFHFGLRYLHAVHAADAELRGLAGNVASVVDPVSYKTATSGRGRRVVTGREVWLTPSSWLHTMPNFMMRKYICLLLVLLADAVGFVAERVLALRLCRLFYEPVDVTICAMSANNQPRRY
ncbi:hypothetical protein M514_01686 [Trichuris suis]|uniref:Uncharacterized protein n=1 Tax=Trichuris suis TaxID=68888 RepID=A0A085MK37_9BILA|nr:hypothetical protein M513_01686 [Trichuris suis]KFD64871.1 hypothetical protein M514_01686 [Trichuris suis]